MHPLPRAAHGKTLLRAVWQRRWTQSAPSRTGDPVNTLADLLADGRVLDAHDLAQITARLATLVRQGHEMGATHGDISPETVLVSRQDDEWSVHLEQPRAQAAGAEPADDILAVGWVVDRLSRALPRNANLPASFSPALASMTSSDVAHRPTAAQVQVYFSADFPAALDSDTDDSDDDYDDHEDTTAIGPGYHPAASTQRPARASRAALVIASLILLLGVGSLGYVVWSVLAPETGPDTAQPPVTAPVNEDVAAAEEPADPAELTGSEAPPTDVPAGSDEETTDPIEVAVDTEAEPDEGQAPTAPRPATDHTDPQWGDHGWDVPALDNAYCRDGSRFVGLADSDTYRGVICNGHFGFEYRGLNKAGNATILTSAETTSTGWVGHGPGGVRYEFDEDTFEILGGDGSVLDEEDVNLWLTPQDTPFRPGDLDLDQPISYPACDGSGAVVHSSYSDPPTDAENVQAALDSIPGSFYVRTDLSCDTFNRPSAELSDGNYIYAVLTYGGSTRDGLCESIDSSGGSYGYFLTEGVEPGVRVTCD